MKKDLITVIIIIVGAALIFADAVRDGLQAQAMEIKAAAAAEITEEERERREQAAYYKGWQDGSKYFRILYREKRSQANNDRPHGGSSWCRLQQTTYRGGTKMTVKDYYETIQDIDRLAEVVDAPGAVTLDHDDAELIWGLLLDYKDLLMAKEVG